MYKTDYTKTTFIDSEHPLYQIVDQTYQELLRLESLIQSILAKNKSLALSPSLNSIAAQLHESKYVKKETLHQLIYQLMFTQKPSKHSFIFANKIPFSFINEPEDATKVLLVTPERKPSI